MDLSGLRACLKHMPRVDLGVVPTPVEEHRIDGLTILVKRDDRTAPRYGGNKVRGLQFLLAQPAERFLTFSSLSAHHAYAVASYARELDKPTDAILVRQGQRTPAADALRDVADRVVEVGGVLGAAWRALRWRRKGTRIIPPGGASPHGAMGYLEAALELETIPSRIYLPLGSGTTASGLLAGLQLRGARTEVVAVRVADPFFSAAPLLWRRARKTIELLRKHAPNLPKGDKSGIQLRIVKADGKYGEDTESARAAIEAAQDLPIETTYTAKTLAVLLRERPEGAMFLQTHAPGCGPDWIRRKDSKASRLVFGVGRPERRPPHASVQSRL